MKTKTQEIFMTTNKTTSGRYNYMEGRFDMTQIPRLNENTGDPKLDALNKRCNENSERVEDLWIELDLQLIDAMEAEKKRKASRKVNHLKREVRELFTKGYLASEIHSITRASMIDIAKWTKNGKLLISDEMAFEDCPEDIKADLDEWDV
jgi:hypothetical protein|tara:strand:+ start:478 stop:927 length:450 start_codon:yes stop_codon:yes gene_type:complete